VTSRRIRGALLAPLAVTLALVAGAPAASASPFPATGAGLLPGAGYNAGAGSCGRSSAEGMGGPGDVTNQQCLGAGLVFVGPSIGQIATVIGPTIIGPANIGTSVISAGDVGVGY
jgi:hypothetical protein